MGLKAAVQALQKAEVLKEKLHYSQDLLNDNDAWACQQQLQKIYQQVLILDLEYALDKKVEQDLWNHGFKHYIAAIQQQTKDKKNPKRAEFQALLSWCLDTASGFYLMLLQEICAAFNLDLPFRRKGLYGRLKKFEPAPYISQPQRNSCHYLCQYCLVHLGDLARYRNASRQAEAFYKHAIQLSPSSGQPYNQLALLETSRGDKLSTVFHYVRSVAVAHPFPAAISNLSLTFEKCLETTVTTDGKKLTSSEYIALFLKLHALFHLPGDFSECETLVRLLTSSLTSQVATEAFSSWKLVQMMVVNMYGMHHLMSEGTQLTTELTADERTVRSFLIDMIAGSLNAFLISVYMLKQEALLEYFALPVIKVTLDFLRLDPQLLNEPGFVSRPQIWPSLAKLLNNLQPSLNNFKEKSYNSVPLPEDKDLQGFVPLEEAFSGLTFNHRVTQHDKSILNKLRALRLVSFGKWLANAPDLSLLSAKDEGEIIVFEASSTQVQPSAEFLQELKELQLNKLVTPPSGSPSPSSVTPTPTPPEFFDNNQVKRGGILKPSSLKKTNVEDFKGKGRQNVAMQAILRKNNEHDSKQVTFKTPSPTCSVQSQPEWPPTAPTNTSNSFPHNSPPFFERPQFLPNASSPSPHCPASPKTPPGPPPNYPPTFCPPSQNLGFHSPHSKFFPPQVHGMGAQTQPINPPVFSTQPPQEQFNPWNGVVWFNPEEKDKRLSAEQVQNENHMYSDPNAFSRPAVLEEQRSVPQNPEFMKNGMWEPVRPASVYSEVGTLNMQVSNSANNAPQQQLNTYSLFSPAWGRQPFIDEPTETYPPSENALNMALLAHQSLWSGPGPSPLERLLEQQKQLRNPK
ncbi:unnamed protein product [Bemisia tabaci]|uniref:Protein SMG7 n=1 Tax=Bemisia tabaci TaxID=7038 RepID=A0A9P0F1R4_BEMTA|nr:unnamed protein product [Bemisia tabaci]